MKIKTLWNTRKMTQPRSVVPKIPTVPNVTQTTTPIRNKGFNPYSSGFSIYLNNGNCKWYICRCFNPYSSGFSIYFNKVKGYPLSANRYKTEYSFDHFQEIWTDKFFRDTIDEVRELIGTPLSHDDIEKISKETK